MRFELDPSVATQIQYECKARFPDEACGFIVNNGKGQRAIPCKNQALSDYGQDMFVLDGKARYEAQKVGEVVAIYHTHPHTAPYPSIADRRGCQKSGIPWVICSDSFCTVTDPADVLAPVPLLGRPFMWGVFDCYSLLQDYYLETFNIELPDYDRGLLFEWEKPDGDWNQFLKHYKDAGFVELPDGETLQKGDVFLMNLSSDKINHCGVLVDANRNVFYHHVLNRLSEETIYGGWYRDITRYTMRHSKLIFSPPVLPIH